MRDVGMVLDKLIAAGFAVKCEKVYIGMTSVPYLGFNVGRDGTTPRAEKTKAILDLVYEDMRAGGATAAARYAGMIGFYHRFIPNLHSVLAPFHACKSKDAPIAEIMMSLQMRTAFEFSKHCLANVTALARPDYTKTFYIDVDAASSSGAGAVLSQRDDENDPDSHRPLAFWSRRFCDEERRYGVRDQECLGLADAVTNWRHIILGARVIVRTDHRSLQWLLATLHKPGTRASGWVLKLQGYDMEIEYVPGSQHLVADFVSRQPGQSTTAVPSETTSREPIEDRVYDALDTATEYRDAQTAKRRATLSDSPPAVASAHIEVDEIMEMCGYNLDDARARQVIEEELTADIAQRQKASQGGGNLGLTDTGTTGTESKGVPLLEVFSAFCTGATLAPPTADTAACDAQEPEPPAKVTTTVASRAAVAFIKRADDGSLLTLVERQDTCTSLPSVDLSHLPLEHKDLENLHKPRPLMYRAQLAAHLLHTYNDPSLAEQLGARTTTACRRRDARSAHTHFFVGDGNSLCSSPSPRFIGSVEFVRVDEALLSQLDRDDAMFLAKLDNLNLSLNPARETIPWGADGTKARKAIENILQPPTTALAAQTTFRQDLIDTPLPSLADAPNGPAFINTPSDFITASKYLRERLTRHPDLSMAVDLEGHQLGAHGKTSLIQVAVDSNAPEEQPLVYVFDMLLCDACLRDLSSDLRAVLERPDILKIFHCCYGDAAALFHEYGVVLRGIFDTGIADCIARAQHPQKARRLDRVLTYWLGEEVVLSFKEQVQHEPGLWLTRPVTYPLFVYSFEDVTYCNRLATVLRTQLQSQGLWGLALTLSQQRAPPRGLPPSHALYAPPVTAAIALVDASGRVLCRRQGGSLSLPSDHFQSVLGPKEEARRIWRELMGEPPKLYSLRCAINSRMRKGVLVGNTLLFVSYVKDLLDCLPLLEAALHDNSFGLCLRPVFCACGPSAGCLAEQAPLFQYLHAIAACTNATSPALVPTFGDNTPTTLHVAAPLVVSSTGRVTVPLHALARSRPGAVATANAATTHPLRVAVIVHDDTTAFSLTTHSGGNAFPSAAIEEDASRESTAARAFDLFAGCSLRKRTAPSTIGPNLQLMPRTSSVINAAFDTLTDLGVHGNVQYFACRLPPSFLRDHASSFYASRRPGAGFQLTAQVLKKFPGFDLTPLDALLAVRRLGPYDRAALQRL